MNKTGIEYLDFSWSPIAMRCTPIAAGCSHCWHLVMCDRLKENHRVFGHNMRARYAGEMGPMLIPKRLDAPLKRKKPARIGLQFMGDLFHKDISAWMQDDVFEVILAAQQHTFILLTKRIERTYEWADSTNARSDDLLKNCPNLHLGVSISTQEDADRLIPILLQIPAAVRFVSVEPMLEKINFRWESYAHDATGETYRQYLDRTGSIEQYESLKGIGWVIIGCESGPKRRETKIEWIEALARQCESAGVPCFIKQAEINGKIVSMPEIQGKVWNQYPEGCEI